MTILPHRLMLILALSCPVMGLSRPPEAFYRALHTVETGGRTGRIEGDSGAALGPLQIHRAYHADSGVPGTYEQCADLTYSRRVVAAYLQRYAPKAYDKGDVKTLARVHNGGPKGHLKAATLPYWIKVQRALK